MRAISHSPAPHAQWTPAWTASPQPVWSHGLPLEADVPLNLHDATIRQIIRLGYGGDRIRLMLSNRYGHSPIRLAAVCIAPSIRGCQIQTARNKNVLFGDAETTIIPPGAIVTSDAVSLRVKQGDDLAISIRITDAPKVGDFHWEGRRTAYIFSGNHLNDASPHVQNTTERRLFLAGLLVEAVAPRGVVVTFGDSITDGTGATLDRETRWPDLLAARVARLGFAVVNAGVSGARLLSDGMGASALARFDQEVASQPGVSTVTLLLGINDIAWPGTPFAPNEPPMTFQRMISGYRAVIERARAANLRVIGGTLPPFAGALPDTPMAATYYSRAKDDLRRSINNWIRTSQMFDATIDFDSLLEDFQNPGRLLPLYDSGDHLHPGDEGNRAMADAVDLEALLDL